LMVLLSRNNRLNRTEVSDTVCVDDDGEFVTCVSLVVGYCRLVEEVDRTVIADSGELVVF